MTSPVIHILQMTHQLPGFASETATTMSLSQLYFALELPSMEQAVLKNCIRSAG